MADNTWTPISGYTPQDYTDTAVFEVNPDTKKIALITGQALVAGEENSQYIKFLMPRYWDGIDIKDKDFYVEYALAGTYYGKTAAVNGEYNTEQVRFGWIVPKEACCISGTLLFVLRIESTDYVLKTQIAEHPVFKSVNVEDVVPEPTKEAWYRDFEARVETAIDDAEAALTAAQAAQTAAENAAQNAQTSEENAETAAAMAQTRYGSPLTAAEADEMIEQNRVYVYVGSETGYTNGHWYYYNGTEWADGGVYNGSAVNTDTTLTQSGMAADAKATGDEIRQIKEDFTHTISKNLIGMEVGVLYPVFIKAGTKLTISTSDGSNFPSSSTGILYLYLYDKDGNRTDYFGLANGQPTRTITTSASKADTYYLAWNRKYDVPLQVEIGDTKTDYSEYFLSVEALNEVVKPIGNHIANIGDLLGNVSIKNLLDTSKAIDGGYYDSDNVWVSNENLYVSDLIPCVDGMRYINNYTQNINLYDYNGNHIGYVRNSDSDRSFVASSEKGKVCYFRVYGLISNKTTDAVFVGGTYYGTAEMFPYNEVVLLNKGTKRGLYGKTVVTFGDSRTWYDGNAYVANTTIAGQICKGYQFWMRKLLQCVIDNQGKSGYTSPQMYTVVHNADLTSADVVTLAGGINDFLQSIPVGIIGAVGGTFDTTTVYGATQAMIEDILSKKPSVKLMLINPFTGWINNDADEYPDTYANVKRNLAELYHLPILDLTRSCGFNALNRNTFYCDDMTKVSYRLHLNDFGNEVIGHMIASFVGNGY